jgi:crossover junction endodeoxyribonuclease RuvC
MSIILWIDPGTTTTWFAILKKNLNKIEILDYWIIETKPKESLSLKLVDLGNDLENILVKYKPNIISIEKLFFLKNIKTWIDVAHARWIIVYVAAKKWIKIIELTPLQIKKWICGNWNANKIQVQNALKFILNLDTIPKPDDAADALAIAYIASLY